MDKDQKCPPGHNNSSELVAVDDTIAKSDQKNAGADKQTNFDLAEQFPTAPQVLFGRGAVIAGRFKLLEQLGQGGMGTVFLAEQTSPVVRRVALKVIKFGVDSATTLARFEQERQMLAMMDHDNIAKVYDGGVTEQGFPFIVLELVKGMPITKYCDEKKLSLRERLALFLPVCHAIQHAHQKGIIHRDLKPANILVSERMNTTVVKVIDFGVAKAIYQRISDHTILTERGSIVGTLEYMAPEQAGTNQLDIDTRADIYSLGAILYELFTGSTPFTKKQLRETTIDVAIRMIREIDPPRPSTKISKAEDVQKIAITRHDEPAHLSQEIARELDWVAMKCLEKDRNRRYESVSNLIADINHYLRDEPVSAHPPSRGYRFKKYFKRHRTTISAITAVVAALIIGLVVMSVGLIRAVEAEKETQAENDIHKALLAFINEDLFIPIDLEERANLGIPLDRDLKVRALLERAGKQLDQGRYNDKPLVEASLRSTVGKAYLSLNLLQEAKKHLQIARDLQLKHRGASHLETLETLEALGEVELALGHYETAKSILQDVYQHRSQNLGKSSRKTLKTFFQLCVIETELGKYQEAQKHFNELIDLQKGTFAPSSNEVIHAKSHLASILLKLGQPDQSAALFQEIIADAIKAYGKKDSLTLMVKNNYAQSLREQRKTEAALPIYQEIIPDAEKLYDSDDIVLALYKNNYSSALLSMKRYSDAEKILNEIVPIFIQKLTKEHPKTLIVRSNQAFARAKAEDYRKALEIYTELKPSFFRVFGATDVPTENVLVKMVDCYVAIGDFEQARSHALEYIACLVERKNASAESKLANVQKQIEALAKKMGKETELAAFQKEVERIVAPGNK